MAIGQTECKDFGYDGQRGLK